MLVEVSRAEFKHLWEWYVGPKNGVPYDEVFGKLLNRMQQTQCESTMTLPGPDGEPNVLVPQEGWLD